jgi:ferredoxin-NADP reductase
MNPTLYPITFIEKLQEYDDIYSFRFHKLPELKHLAGQHCTLHTADNVEQTEYARPMTFADAPHETFFQFTTHTSSKSLFKQSLLSLKPGGTAFISHIRGIFFIENQKKVLCIGGGIGMTPFRSIILDELHTNRGVDIDLVHVHRDSYIFSNELFHLPFAQTHTPFGSLLPELNKRTLQNYENILVSGSPRFVTAVREMLVELQYDSKNIKLDLFNGYDFD